MDFLILSRLLLAWAKFCSPNNTISSNFKFCSSDYFSLKLNFDVSSQSFVILSWCIFTCFCKLLFSPFNFWFSSYIFRKVSSFFFNCSYISLIVTAISKFFSSVDGKEETFWLLEMSFLLLHGVGSRFLFING